MDRRPTPDPGSTEKVQGEPDYAAVRRRLKQQPIPENEGLTKEGERSPADASTVEGPDEGRESEEAREAAAQRGRAAN